MPLLLDEKCELFAERDGLLKNMTFIYSRKSFT